MSNWKFIKKIDELESINNSINSSEIIKTFSNDFIQENIDLIFSNDSKESVLCVGQVQSGKTSNIIKSIQYGIENGYKIILFFAGITNILLSQTVQRVKKTILNNNNLVFLETENQISNMSTYLKNGNIVISLVLKNSGILKKLFGTLNYMDLSSEENKVLIIDDECDYASINLKNGSSVHKKIADLYERIHNGKLLNFTGTPFANLLNENSNSTKADKVVVLKNYDDYCGCEFFNDSNAYVVEEYNKNNNYEWNEYIQHSFKLWIVSTAIGMVDFPQGFKSEFLINVEIKNDEQKILLKKVLKNLEDFTVYSYSSTDSWLEQYLIENDFEEYINKIELIKKNIGKVLNYLVDNLTETILLLNSENENSNDFKSGQYDFSIIIGGNMVSRGFTFENLICELFLNNPENETTIDTLLQKCRWFGNRKQKIKYMRIIVNEKIKNALMDAQKYIELFKNGTIMSPLALKHEILSLDKENSYKNRNVVSTNAEKRR